MRLDKAIASQYDISREKAQTWIAQGNVRVNGRVVRKAAQNVSDNAALVLDSADDFVGRGAYKLLGFFDNHPDIAPTQVLDIGSSTGGFAQILLQKGAQQVVCVDVGSAQLHSRIRADSRVRVFEQTDIRDFRSAPFPLITCDVSFVSLAHILPSIARLCAGEAIVLFKPQFEVGRDAKRNKKGVVLDSVRVEQALHAVCAQCQSLGFVLRSIEACACAGKEGNAESFLYLSR